jgi:hypothetical protein
MSIAYGVLLTTIRGVLYGPELDDPQLMRIGLIIVSVCYMNTDGERFFLDEKNKEFAYAFLADRESYHAQKETSAYAVFLV